VSHQVTIIIMIKIIITLISNRRSLYIMSHDHHSANDHQQNDDINPLWLSLSLYDYDYDYRYEYDYFIFMMMLMLQLRY